MNAIPRAADLLWDWSHQIDETHAEPRAAERMREIATAARAEYARLTRSPNVEIEALIKGWALRELEALPRGAWRDWTSTGQIPPWLQLSLARLPEQVVALVLEHVADELGQCECCRRRAPCRLQYDGSESGERDWRCAWGCPPGEDPAETIVLRDYPEESGP